MSYDLKPHQFITSVRTVVLHISLDVQTNFQLMRIGVWYGLSCWNAGREKRKGENAAKAAEEKAKFYAQEALDAQQKAKDCSERAKTAEIKAETESSDAEVTVMLHLKEELETLTDIYSSLPKEVW